LAFLQLSKNFRPPWPARSAFETHPTRIPPVHHGYNHVHIHGIGGGLHDILDVGYLQRLLPDATGGSGAGAPLPPTATNQQHAERCGEFPKARTTPSASVFCLCGNARRNSTGFRGA